MKRGSALPQGGQTIKTVTHAEPILIQAKWVAPINPAVDPAIDPPMDQPAIRNGAVVVAGDRIIAVGGSSALRGAYANARIIDLPRGILLPGLVNAHTHLELSDCSASGSDGAVKPDLPGQKPEFVSWLVGMLRRTRISDAAMAEKVTAAIALGVGQCQRFGVTTIGDISRQPHLTRPLLRDARLRVVSFGEIMAMAQRRGLLAERLAMAVDRNDVSQTLSVGLTPHSPYSVEIDAYRRCVQIAAEADLPIATHLAETPHEAEFLARHTGPLRDLWDAWLTWDDHVPTFAGGPIRLAGAVGLLDYPSLLAHVNYCDDDELDLLADGRASVVYCPRTHAFFDHPPHRFAEMLARGVNVAAGTDSCASSPDLNLLDELRLIRKLSPQLSSEAIWRMGTINGARALRLENDVGSLTAGKRADLISFEVETEDPLGEILRSDHNASEVWFGGEARWLGR